MNSEALVCEYNECKLILENPVTLSCGSSLCQKHLEKFCGENFICPICDNEHQIPNDGFFVNKSMAKMVDAYFEMDPLKQKIRKSFSI